MPFKRFEVVVDSVRVLDRGLGQRRRKPLDRGRQTPRGGHALGGRRLGNVGAREPPGPAPAVTVEPLP